MKTHIVIINQILEISKPFIEQLGEKELKRKIEALHESNRIITQQKALSNPKYSYRNIIPFVEGMFDKYIIEFKQSIVYDMIRSLSKNCEATDKLVGDITLSSRGTVEIQCQIERDGVVNNYKTSLITAGGYNIQCYHYRYITKTTLGASKDPKWLDKQLKVEEIEQLKKTYEVRISKAQSELAIILTKTDEENALDWYKRTVKYKLSTDELEALTSLPESVSDKKTIKKYSKTIRQRFLNEIADCEKEIDRCNKRIEKIESK